MSDHMKIDWSKVDMRARITKLNAENARLQSIAVRETNEATRLRVALSAANRDRAEALSRTGAVKVTDEMVEAGFRAFSDRTLMREEDMSLVRSVIEAALAKRQRAAEEPDDFYCPKCGGGPDACRATGCPGDEPAAPKGQQEAVDWKRVDDALVSCAGLLKTICRDDIGDTAAAELEYVRSVVARPAEQAVTEAYTPVPTHECELRIGQAVHVLEPASCDDPSTIFYVVGISWEHRMVASRGWNITIATQDEIEKGYGQTDGYDPSDLRPTLKAAMEAGRHE